ncbi:MAG: FAD-dependent oxidoreductase, partial [Trebonia sp.]
MSPIQVVVAGHGMVGARFAEEVRRHDPDGRRVRLTILAAEPRPAYNRILLPNLLAGTMKEADFATTAVAGLPVVTGQETRSIPNGSVLHPDAPMTLRVGTTVIGIDPAGKTVLARRAAAGPDETAVVDRIGYDVLVLATGARAVVPPLPGLLAGHPAETGNGAGRREARLRSDDRLSADVAALHSLADARRIAAFAQSARRTGGRVAVLG